MRSLRRSKRDRLPSGACGLAIDQQRWLDQNLEESLAMIVFDLGLDMGVDRLLARITCSLVNDRAAAVSTAGVD
jgi:hypothetical protein